MQGRMRLTIVYPIKYHSRNEHSKENAAAKENRSYSELSSFQHLLGPTVILTVDDDQICSDTTAPAVPAVRHVDPWKLRPLPERLPRTPREVEVQDYVP